MDINDPTQAADIHKIIKEGVQSEFWQLILQSLDKRWNSLKDVFDSEDFDNLSADEYRLAHVAAKITKQEIKNMKQIPEDIFHSLETGTTEKVESADPYKTAQDFLPSDKTE